MAVFPATYFPVPAVKYPENGNRVQFANSYAFTAGPQSPDVRIFTVTLTGMAYFGVAGALDTTSELGRNMAVLEAFYQTVHCNTVFDFPHPVWGTLQCKFNRPLELPEGMLRGFGMLTPFTVELIEQP